MDAAEDVGLVVKDYRLEEQVGYLMRLASQRHAVIFQKFLPTNLTPTQFSTLIRLADNGPTSQNHLGRLAAMDSATTKGVVDRLKVKGLVTSSADVDDKRRSVISLTDEGAHLIATLKTAGADISKRTLEPLTDEEQDQLVALLKKIT